MNKIKSLMTNISNLLGTVDKKKATLHFNELYTEGIQGKYLS